MLQSDTGGVNKLQRLGSGHNTGLKSYSMTRAEIAVHVAIDRDKLDPISKRYICLMANAIRSLVISQE